MKTYHQIAIFFAITQLLGIFSGITLITFAQGTPEINELSVAPMPEQNDPLNAVFFICYILLGAIGVLLFARFYKGVFLFQLLEFMVITSASSVVFFTISLSLGLDFIWSFCIAGIAALIFALAKFVFADVKNAAAIISSAGVGALFGFSLGFMPAVLFIILLSIYDYVAVFKTKHMIEMARELSTRQLSFAVTAKSIPPVKKGEGQAEYSARVVKTGERLDLGTGDLSIPTMISVSAYSLGPNGLIYALAVAFGSTLSLFLLLKFVSKQRVFLPALPPICLGGMTALLLVRLAGF